MDLDDIFEIVLVVVVLSVTVVYGYSLTMPIYYEENDITKNSPFDKTAQLQSGYLYDEEGKEALAWQEVILMTQIQDDGLPNIDKYKVQNSTFTDATFEMSQTYPEREELMVVATTAFGAIKKTDPTLNKKWSMGFSYGTDVSQDDDFYRFELAK